MNMQPSFGCRQLTSLDAWAVIMHTQAQQTAILQFPVFRSIVHKGPPKL